MKDLNLFDEDSEVLTSRLEAKKCLNAGTKFTFLPHQGKRDLPYFHADEGLVFCSNVEGLLLKMGIPQYRTKNWRLFIDSSKRSLKWLLLHNGNKCASIPTGYSTNSKKNTTTLKECLKN